MNRRAARVAAALLFLAWAARAGDGPDEATAESAPGAAPAGPAAPSDFLVRPHLQLSGLFGDGRLGLSADAGLRVEGVVARFSYLVVGASDGGYVTYASGRAGYVVMEGRWAALIVGAGVGGLTYSHDPAGTTNATAAVAEGVCAFFPREWLGPLTVGLQVLSPLHQTPDLAGAQIPTVLVSVGMNPLVVLFPFLVR